MKPSMYKTCLQHHRPIEITSLDLAMKYIWKYNNLMFHPHFERSIELV